MELQVFGMRFVKQSKPHGPVSWHPLSLFGYATGCRVQRFAFWGSRVQGLRFRIWGSRFRVQGLGFRIWDSFRI